MTYPSQQSSQDKLDQERRVGTPELTAPGQTPILTNIFQCSAEFLQQLRFWLEQNPPTIPIANIPGFSQFTTQIATRVDTSETTSSTTYTDLSTVGPKLTMLPDGQYVFMFGFAYTYTSGSNVSAYMSLKVNSTEAADSDALIATGPNTISLTGTVRKTLSGGGNNTVTARYKVAGTSPVLNFSFRWLVGFRTANA